MNNLWTRIVKLLAGIGGGIAGVFGGWNAVIGVLLGMMAVDYLTGLMLAWMGRSTKSAHGGLSSAAGAKGLARKGLMLLVVLVGAMLDRVLGTQGSMCRDAVCWFYIANEGLSFLENLSGAGIPFPKKLKELLGQKLEQEEQKIAPLSRQDIPDDGDVLQSKADLTKAAPARDEKTSEGA